MTMNTNNTTVPYRPFLRGSGIGLGVWWVVWSVKGFWWGVLYGLGWPVWVGYRMAEFLTR